MTKEEAKEFYPILKSYAEGKVIECRTKPDRLKGVVDIPNKWTETNEIWCVNSLEYRIKPEQEPKYRPFANAEECWQEMLKHEPFGWVKTKDKGIRLYIVGLNQKRAFTQVGHNYDEAIDEFTFSDGTPFGILEEE